ncbi:MAG: hypothetical protein GF398_03510 [Chitinivibrionales bacterium]|nr:hypothetical protein [Chitinivibrionales bacterium]
MDYHPEHRHILGIPEMDEQHAYLYSLFDKIEEAASATDAGAMKKLLDEIEGYLLFHITSEEHLIRHYSVPGFAAHQTDHEYAAARFVRFLEEFDREELNPARMRIFLTGWLMEHSSISDEHYARHIKDVRSAL